MNIEESLLSFQERVFSNSSEGLEMFGALFGLFAIIMWIRYWSICSEQKQEILGLKAKILKLESILDKPVVKKDLGEADDRANEEMEKTARHLSQDAKDKQKDDMYWDKLTEIHEKKVNKW